MQTSLCRDPQIQASLPRLSCVERRTQGTTRISPTEFWHPMHRLARTERQASGNRGGTNFSLSVARRDGQITRTIVRPRAVWSRRSCRSPPMHRTTFMASWNAMMASIGWFCAGSKGAQDVFSESTPLQPGIDRGRTHAHFQCVEIRLDRSSSQFTTAGGGRARR